MLGGKGVADAIDSDRRATLDLISAALSGDEAATGALHRRPDDYVDGLRRIGVTDDRLVRFAVRKAVLEPMKSYLGRMEKRLSDARRAARLHEAMMTPRQRMIRRFSRQFLGVPEPANGKTGRPPRTRLGIAGPQVRTQNRQRRDGATVTRSPGRAARTSSGASSQDPGDGDPPGEPAPHRRGRFNVGLGNWLTADQERDHVARFGSVSAVRWRLRRLGRRVVNLVEGEAPSAAFERLVHGNRGLGR
jgi:hypothetical protein